MNAALERRECYCPACGSILEPPQTYMDVKVGRTNLTIHLGPRELADEAIETQCGCCGAIIHAVWWARQKLREKR